MDQITVFVGIDWGAEQHVVCALDGGRKVLLERSVRHDGAALASLAKHLAALAQGGAHEVAVAIEVTRGTIVDTLLERGVRVFALNPKQLDRFRDRYTVAGAKDDRRDAFVLADSLRTDIGAYRELRVGDETVVLLREASRSYDELRDERIMHCNRLREQLWRYYPQILELGSVHDAPWLWALVEAAPTPDVGIRMSLAKLQSILKKHRIRRVTAEAVRAILRAEPLYVAPGVAEACRRHVLQIVARLRLVDEQKEQCERDIAALLDVLSTPVEPDRTEGEPGKSEHRDARLLRSLPGVGDLVCATMLAEAPEAIDARDYTTLRGLCGVAPVTKQSGKRLHVVAMRRACSQRLRQAIHFWAASAANVDPVCKKMYLAHRARGHSHARTLRGIGDRLLALLVAVLKSRTPYDRGRRDARAASNAA